VKLEEKPQTVKRINIKSEGAYTIESNPIAFDILSKKLYRSPHLAVQRELYSNALDAHTEAKIKTQPQVHIPSRWEPHFSIRDFGKGLNKEDLIYLYTTYFSSSKRGTNEQIGGFGIGAQSVWSVTDNFTVTSIHKGIKYIYLMFKNEDRVPSYTLVSEAKTGEPSGMEIKVSVPDAEIESYFADAGEVYKYFSIKPQFAGRTPIISEDEPNLKGSNWYTTDIYRNRYSASYDTKVVMGGVAYPISFSEVKNLGETADKLAQCGLVITVDIGFLEVAASREELSYTRKTKLKIEELFQNIEKEYSALVQKDINGAKDYFEACCIANRMPIFPNQVVYQGRLIVTSHAVTLQKPLIKFSHYRYGRKKYEETHYNGTQTLTVGQISNLYEKDIDQTSYARCQQRVVSTGADVWLAEPCDAMEIARVFGYDYNSTPQVSSLTYTKSARTGTKVTGIYKIACPHYRTIWQSSSVDFVTQPKGLYIGFFNRDVYHEFKDGKHKTSSLYFYDHVKKYMEHKGLVGDVYGVQKDKMPRFKKQGWINVLETAERDLDDYLTDPAMNVQLTGYLDWIDFELAQSASGFIQSVNTQMIQSQVLVDFFSYYQTCQKIHKEHEKKFHSLMEMNRTFFGKPVIHPKNLNILFDKVLKYYDLLGILIDNGVNARRINQYISDTDRLSRQSQLLASI